jgi:enamine deaminase RidA (YjgF/YER057c/UK114 family)
VKVDRFKLTDLPPAVSPYCDAVRAGDLIFISGLTGGRLDGTIGATVTEQYEQILTYLEKVLVAAGSSRSQVVTVTIYVRNIEDRPKIIELRKAFFAGALPASAIVEVNKLYREDILIEMSAVAAVA